MWEWIALGPCRVSQMALLVSILSPKLQEPHSSTWGPARISAAPGRLLTPQYGHFPSPNQVQIHTDPLLLPQTRYKSTCTPCSFPKPRTNAHRPPAPSPNWVQIHTDTLLLPQTSYKFHSTPCCVPSPPCKGSSSPSCLGRKGENGHLLCFFYHLGLLKTAQQIKNRWEQRWGNDIKGCRKFSVYF